MIFTETPISGSFVLDLERRSDERGFFARAWCADEFAAHGLTAGLAQANLSLSKQAGTLRGMHYQRPPHEEAKLVRCTRGAIFDVLVDLRPASATYTQWFGVELTPENGRALYVPEGCAHGFQALTEGTETFYLVSEPHAPASEAGVRWDDAAFGIEWPHAQDRLLSPKDGRWPDFEPEHH